MPPLFVPATSDTVHLPKLVKKFGAIDSPGAPIPPDVKYLFVCFTNRCGSNYLCELLTSDRKYNLAEEQLNWNSVVQKADLHGLKSFRDYFSWLATTQSRENLLILKSSSVQLELLSRAGILDEIAPRSHFVLIERSDKLAQAISYVLAFATGKYTSRTQSDKNVEDVPYSRESIDQILKRTTLAYKQFDDFFAYNGITPIHIIYEHLTSAPVFFCNLIAKIVGMSGFEAKPGRIRLKKQSNEVNESWRQTYLSGRA